jgi:hypothetical protein
MSKEKAVTGETVNHQEALTVIQGKKDEQANPNAVIPVYCCEACGSLYADEEGKKVVHNDTNPDHETCECAQLVLVDAKSVKLNDGGNVVGARRL